jgi:SAM-dependent methyltransferase
MPVFRRHTEVLAETVPLAGRRALEVGCGDGRLMGWLAARAALAVGLDPDPAQLARAEANRGAGPLVRAVAERLPFAAAAFDLVLLFNSLHHVPVDRQSAALAEAARVLRPGGDLLVAEPLAGGPWFELMRPLEDETEIRAHAQRALREACRTGRFEALTETTYPSRVEVPSLAAAIDRLLAATRRVRPGWRRRSPTRAALRPPRRAGNRRRRFRLYPADPPRPPAKGPRVTPPYRSQPPVSVSPARDEAERRAAFALRREVFVGEQGVRPEAEFDAYDRTATHLVARLGADEVVVGALRWRVAAPGVGKIERVAVRRDLRGSRIGVALMDAVLADLTTPGSPRPS